MAEEQLRVQQEIPSRIERRVYVNPEEDYDDEDEENKPTHHKPGLLNFLAMILFAATLDLIGAVSDEVPGVGPIIVLISDMVLMPWMQMSGMTLNAERLLVTIVENIGESIPGVGNFPLITANVIISYYLN